MTGSRVSELSSELESPYQTSGAHILSKIDLTSLLRSDSSAKWGQSQVGKKKKHVYIEIQGSKNLRVSENERHSGNDKKASSRLRALRVSIKSVIQSGNR